MAWTSTNNLRVILSPKTQCCQCEALDKKMYQNLKSLDRAKLFAAFDLYRRASHFGVVGRQNRIKNAELCPFKVGAKVVSWPSLGQKLAILAIFLRYGVHICFAHHSIDIKGQKFQA